MQEMQIILIFWARLWNFWIILKTLPTSWQFFSSRNSKFFLDFLERVANILGVLHKKNKVNYVHKVCNFCYDSFLSQSFSCNGWNISNHTYSELYRKVERSFSFRHIFHQKLVTHQNNDWVNLSFGKRSNDCWIGFFILFNFASLLEIKWQFFLFISCSWYRAKASLP